MPDETYKFFADGDNTITLFENDVTDIGFFRRDVLVDWGDGSQEEYNTMTDNADDINGLTHIYEESGLYNISVYVNDLLFINTR